MDKAKYSHEESTHNYQKIIKNKLKILTNIPSFYQSIKSQSVESNYFLQSKADAVPER